MKQADIQNFRNSVSVSIRDGKLHDAFGQLRNFSERLMSWETTTQISRLEESYAYMLQYFARGADDPGRPAIYADIVAQMRAITDTLYRRANVAENPKLYYNVLRSASTRTGETIASLIADYRREERRLMTDYDSLAEPTRRKEAERILRDLFGRVWVTYPLTAEDTEALLGLLTDPDTRMTSAAETVGAVLLGMMDFYDSRRLDVLLKTYLATSQERPEIALRALTAFLVVMFRYRLRALPASTAALFATVKESAHWYDDFKLAVMELLRSRDTERITRKMNDELYPSLMKMVPKLGDKIGMGDLDIDEFAQGANPEWEEMLTGSGLGDQLREMSEIQAQGGDVFMSTFKDLKQFPFFSEVSNWFVPFHTEQTDVATLDPAGNAAGVLQRMPFLCDSDKYSVALSLSNIPSSKKDMAFKAMDAQAQQSHEMLSEIEKSSESTERKSIINRYVQDLYRFYNLFRRKGDFFNPFDYMINLLNVPELAHEFNDEELLSIVAEFCFSLKFWDDASGLFERLDGISMPDSRRSQKLGFALESAGRLQEAINRYEEAELLEGGTSAWTLRRLAAAHRRNGRPDLAVDYYTRLEQLQPDDFGVILNLAYALTESASYDKAEQQFRKAEYYRPESPKALRGLGWVLFINGKYDESAKMYERLAAIESTPEDLLNAGHVSLARRKTGEALGFYRKALQAAEAPCSKLDEWLEADRKWLTRAGVADNDITLITESVSYNL